MAWPCWGALAFSHQRADRRRGHTWTRSPSQAHLWWSRAPGGWSSSSPPEWWGKLSTWLFDWVNFLIDAGAHKKGNNKNIVDWYHVDYDKDRSFKSPGPQSAPVGGRAEKQPRNCCTEPDQACHCCLQCNHHWWGWERWECQSGYWTPARRPKQPRIWASNSQLMRIIMILPGALSTLLER